MMELLVTMGIFFVLVAAAGPAISNWVIKNRVDTAVVSFRGALNYARYEALNRNSWITVRPNNTSWSTGWYVFTDEGNDGFMGSGDEVLRADILNVVGLTVEWARDMPRISYGLILKKESDEHHWTALKKTIKHYNLPIKLWRLGP
jgi:Tfp pilus assembly protein FimT